MRCKFSDDRRHSRRGYSAGCRCARCRAAWAAYIRERKHATGAARPREASYVDREIAAGATATGDVDVSATLAPLDAQLLAAIQRKTGARRKDVLARLLREYGPDLLRAAA